ncbi:MAG: DnaJ domain-containing protein [Spirochaetales bacterium]|nr:DnaJ domain-containing protein [Spirochaetales bacterium]
MLHRQSAAILGVSPHASELQIRRAYYSLVKKYHPDVAGRTSTVQFSRISDAYRDLLNFTRTRQKQKDDLYLYGNILLKEKDSNKRIAAARALSQSGRPSSYGYLKFALGDSDEQVVRECLRGLAALNIPQAGKELFALYKKSGSRLRREILSVIASLSVPAEYRDILYYAMTDRDPFLKKYAYRIFRTIQRTSGGICHN